MTDDWDEVLALIARAAVTAKRVGGPYVVDPHEFMRLRELGSDPRLSVRLEQAIMEAADGIIDWEGDLPVVVAW